MMKEPIDISGSGHVSDDDLFNRTAVSKTITKTDLNRSINNAARKSTTVSKPVKSLLDSDTDDDPESLFQTKERVSNSATLDLTPAKNILSHPKLVVEITKEKQPKKSKIPLPHLRKSLNHKSKLFDKATTSKIDPPRVILLSRRQETGAPKNSLLSNAI